MPPLSQNSPSETKKIQVHSPYLHARLPKMFPQVNYAYRTRPLPHLSASGTVTSHTLTSLPPVSSTTQIKKMWHPPYKLFHVVIPPFTHHSEGCKQLSPSWTTPLPTEPLSLLLPEFVTMSTVATHTLAISKRLFGSLAPSDTEERPAKMTKQQPSSRNSTRAGDWNLSLPPLCHYLPLTLPF